VAREKTSTNGWVFIFSKLKCILQALKNHHAEDCVAHDLLRVREREKNKCIEPVYQAYQKAQNHMTLSMLVMAFFSVSGSETGID